MRTIESSIGYRLARGPSEESFAAILAACGKAVVDQVNASPRTPSAKKIAKTIEATLRQGFEKDADKPPLTRAADIDFEAAINPETGQPIDFEYSNVEFADAFCPWIRMAFIMLGKDKAGVTEIMRGFLADQQDDDAKLLFDMLESWQIIESKFESLSAFASSAWARVVTALEILEDEDPTLAERLGPAVDRYLAKMRAKEAGQWLSN